MDGRESPLHAQIRTPTQQTRPATEFNGVLVEIEFAEKEVVFASVVYTRSWDGWLDDPAAHKCPGAPLTSAMQPHLLFVLFSSRYPGIFLLGTGVSGSIYGTAMPPRSLPNPLPVSI